MSHSVASRSYNRFPEIVGASVIAGFVLVGCFSGCKPTQTSSTISRSTDQPDRPSATATPQRAPANEAVASSESPQALRQMLAEEELILAITPTISLWDRDLSNLAMPTELTRPQFAEQALILGLAPIDRARSESTTRASDSRVWALTTEAQPIDGTTNFLAPLLERVAFIEHGKFSLIAGHFRHEDWREFTGQVGLAALGRSDDDSWLEIRGSCQVTWRYQGKSPQPTASASDWRIAEWRLEKLETRAADQLLFRDTLDQLVPDVRQRQPLRESQHWIYATRHFYPKRAARADGTGSSAKFFPVSTAYHPGLAVVDINRDGWDDLYIVDRFGKNQLLVRQLDGTMRDEAARYGIDVEGHSNAAIFADFDNDGDLDLMLGRGTERSLYLVQEEGRFHERSRELIAFPLPYEVSSISAADYNRDGLLDVYFSTYHQDEISRRLDADLAHPDHAIHAMLTPEHSAELKQRFRAETRSFVNQIGPPNILLVNRGGGRFELAPENPAVAVWRNTFQSTWCDYDQDGDPDLYVANDFASDYLLRNNGKAGFEDVTLPLHIDQMGFAMGASWGDYDNDGQWDLYVSNMYSKAGRRITQGIEAIDPQMRQLAMGNYLYRYDGTRFHLVSGLQSPQLTVARAGWAWGGQFVDIDNDGDQDIYVPSGYYTVPAPFETTVDL